MISTYNELRTQHERAMIIIERIKSRAGGVQEGESACESWRDLHELCVVINSRQAAERVLLNPAFLKQSSSLLKLGARFQDDLTRLMPKIESFFSRWVDEARVVNHVPTFFIDCMALVQMIEVRLCTREAVLQPTFAAYFKTHL